MRKWWLWMNMWPCRAPVMCRTVTASWSRVRTRRSKRRTVPILRTFPHYRLLNGSLIILLHGLGKNTCSLGRMGRRKWDHWDLLQRNPIHRSMVLRGFPWRVRVRHGHVWTNEDQLQETRSENPKRACKTSCVEDQWSPSSSSVWQGWNE